MDQHISISVNDITGRVCIPALASENVALGLGGDFRWVFRFLPTLTTG